MTPYACEPALGQVELEFTPQRELLAVTWYGMEQGHIGSLSRWTEQWK